MNETKTKTTRTLLLLAAPVLVACLVACGGAGGGGSGDATTPKTTPQEMADRRKRMDQPKLHEGAKVTLAARESAAGGRIEVSLGAKPGDGKAFVPNGTAAAVIDDPDKGGLFQVRVAFTSGEHAGKTGWVSRGDVERVGERKK